MIIATLRLSLGTVIALATVAAVAGMGTQPSQPHRGYAPRPPGSEPLTRSLTDDAFRTYLDGGFSGQAQLRKAVTESRPYRAHRLAKYTNNDMTSLCWNLPEGVVVVFYDHSNARGKQYVVWGSGQADDLVPQRFNDTVSRWAWYYLGGVDDPPQRMLKALALRPLGARPTRAPVPDDGMFLYASNSFNGLRQKVSNVSTHPPGELQPITAPPDGPLESLHSLQWSLPVGVIVVLYEKSDLTGRQFAVWGSGEQRSTRRWGSAGTVAGWAWFFVGAPGTPAPPES
jgi:hypothetical protein